MKLLFFLVLILISIESWAFGGFLDAISSGVKNTITGGNDNNTENADTNNTKAVANTQLTGFTKKNANVRSTPSTKGSKVGRLVKDTSLNIINTQGSWYQIEANTADGFVQGWIYAPLVTVSSNVTIGTTDKSSSKNRHNVYYAGYSKDFQPVKQMMLKGDINGVEKFFDDREKEVRSKTNDEYELIKNIGLLRWMERGTLGLDAKSLNNSITAFENAETVLKVREESSQASDLLSSITGFAAETISGNEEFQEYEGEGFEKVLMLNYKSIAYLLNGERKAYNTTRRSIDWQQLEKIKFKDKIEQAEKERTEKKSNDEDSAWKEQYKQYDKIANKVASAYVNPFGYYVAGMVQEFESKSDRSLRDNARISYEKALELNPSSGVIKDAVKAMAKKYDKNKRLIHVVVGDGFVPEKKMLVYNIPTHQGMIPVKLPLYEPVNSSVSRIDIQTTSGKQLARLSTVADVEAITMRHQKDSEGLRALRVTLSIARAVGVNQATQNLGFLGSIIGGSVNSMSAPDMRSWMSLPASLQAARLTVSKNLSAIKVVSFDAKGKKLASQVVNINKDSDNFIYARSVEKQLFINRSNKLWL